MTADALGSLGWDRGNPAALGSHIIETSELGPTEVAHLVAQWLRQHLHANKTCTEPG